MAKRILVPLDRSGASELVMPLVADAARGAGATVRLLHVARPRTHVVDKEGHVVVYADQEMSSVESEAMDYLRTLELSLDGVDVEMAVRFGNPVAEILQEAESFGADLIAVVTEGRSALGRAMLGSVAEQILKRAAAPVILLRPGRPAA